MTMRAVKLGDVLNLFNGKAPTLTEDGSVLAYGSNGIIGKSAHHNHPPSIILGRVGAYCGSVKFSPEPFWASDNTIVVRPVDGHDLSYWYYKLQTVSLSNYAGGAAQPLITHSIVKPIETSIHSDIVTQKRVSAILSAYDDLIDNNRRRIELLEEAARLLYREWFVRLQFPGHEHFKIVDGVPAGWRRTSISELSDFLSRGITPTYDDEASGIVINQKCIRSSKLSLTEARRQSKRVPDSKLVRQYDVLINSTGTGTLGRVAQNYLNLPNLTVDSHVTIARPKPDVPPCWYGLTLILKQDFIATLGRGATNQTELSKDDVGAITTIIPTADILEDFESQVSQIVRQITVLSAQSDELAKARDLLLPRLMDGRLEV